MKPLLWPLTVVLFYAAAGLWLYLVIDSFRRKMWVWAWLPVVFPLVAYAAIHLAAPSVASQPQRAILVVAITLVLLTAFWLTVNRRGVTWTDRKSRKDLKRQIKLHLALLTGACIFIVPFVWLLSTSLKEDAEVSKYPPVWIPTQRVTARVDGKQRPVSVLHRMGGVDVAVLSDETADRVTVRALSDGARGGREITVSRSELTEKRRPGLRWRNYADVLRFLPAEYHKGLVPVWNTLYITFLSIIGTVFSSSLVAYSFARLRWPGRDVLFVVLLATMMIPGAVTMLPVFLIFRWLGWIDTLRPLWATSFFAGAFNVFLMRQFFMTIPKDLEDAAKIDGCSYYGTYWRIMLPLVKPALAAVTIMTFIGSWNNFMGPLIYLNTPEKMTISYALVNFQARYGGENAIMMAASTMVMLPVLALFFFTQRYFIQGVTLTGMKE